MLDTETEKVIATLPIGDHCDGAGYDAETGMVFASNEDGTLTVAKEASPGKFEVAQTVTTQQGARTMTIDPKTHLVYLSAGQMGPPPGSSPAGPSTQSATGEAGFVVLAVGK